jgi:transcriptional regulator with XRE-family HTH domain
MELAEAAGISKSYASEILSGARAPARSLAIHIFRETGWRHTLLDGLSDEQIDVLWQVDPWTPSKAAA